MRVSKEVTYLTSAKGIRVSLSLPSPKVVVRTVPFPTARRKSEEKTRNRRYRRETRRATHATAAAVCAFTTAGSLRTQKDLPTEWLVAVHKISELAVEDLEDISMRHRDLVKHDESFKCNLRTTIHFSQYDMN
ncbi:hypothetical protein J6590_086696 [Homalodisca vitripennis]|nr:hypothetical protein J6590_086696 [Homalodisca vitripennis]